jgi:Type II secretion system (T2SS), protein E, N-terminal domain
MRHATGDALAVELAEEHPRGEFGSGLRSRLELVRTMVEVPGPPLPREISPELVLVSPPDASENVLAELIVENVREARREPLGALLSDAGLLDPAEVDFALARARSEGKRLGEVLIEYGLVSSTDVIRFVAEQRGLPFFDIGNLALDRAAAKLLPIDFARSRRTLPIGFVRGLPVVALADPSDDDTMHGTRAILRAAEFVASPEESLLAQLSRVYF